MIQLLSQPQAKCSGERLWVRLCAVWFYVNLTQARVVLEEGTSIEKNATTGLACGQGCGAFSPLMVEGKGPGPLWMVPALDEWSSCNKKN